MKTKVYHVIYMPFIHNETEVLRNSCAILFPALPHFISFAANLQCSAKIAQSCSLHYQTFFRSRQTCSVGQLLRNLISCFTALYSVRSKTCNVAQDLRNLVRCITTPFFLCGKLAVLHNYCAILFPALPHLLSLAAIFSVAQLLRNVAPCFTTPFSLVTKNWQYCAISFSSLSHFQTFF